MIRILFYFKNFYPSKPIWPFITRLLLSYASTEHALQMIMPPRLSQPHLLRLPHILRLPYRLRLPHKLRQPHTSRLFIWFNLLGYSIVWCLLWNSYMDLSCLTKIETDSHVEYYRYCGSLKNTWFRYMTKTLSHNETASKIEAASNIFALHGLLQNWGCIMVVGRPPKSKNIYKGEKI